MSTCLALRRPAPWPGRAAGLLAVSGLASVHMAAQPQARPNTATAQASTSAPAAAQASATWDDMIPPALGQPRDDWDGARRRATQDRGWAAWLASRRKLVDNWASRPRERADLIAGYMHDYVDPANGQPLAWGPDADEPTSGGTPAQQKLHRAWAFHLRGYNLHRLTDAAYLFKATGDGRYADWAANQLDFYAANYQRWPLRTFNGRGRLFQHGLDEATASFGLADAVRLLAGHVDPQRNQQWHSQLLAPMAENLMTVSSPLTNIGFWHAAAVARLGVRLRDDKLVQWGLNGTLGTRATLAASINADGLWREGSLSYNAWMVDALAALVTAFSLEEQAEPLAAERQALRQLVLTPLQLRFDNGMLPTPSDAAPLPALDANRLASIYRVLPTWWGLTKAATQPTWATLVQPPAKPGTQPTLPPAQTRHLEASRMAVLRAGPWQAFVHYGQSVPYHAQEEALSFELHQGTAPISTDPGTVTYGSPFHNHYFSRAASHNVPLADGQGQQRWAPGVVDQFDPAQALIRVTHPDYQPGVRVTRSFQATSTGFATHTQMQASDGKPRRLGEALHTACTVTPGDGLQRLGSDSQTPPQNAATAYWQDIVAYRTATRWAVQLSCGDDSITYSVTAPVPQTLFIGRAPTTPLPAMRQVLYYETRGPSSEFMVTVSSR